MDKWLKDGLNLFLSTQKMFLRVPNPKRWKKIIFHYSSPEEGGGVKEGLTNVKMYLKVDKNWELF